MIDWEAAEAVLLRAAREQLADFLDEFDRDDLYGLGFFASSYEGVALVAAGRRAMDEQLRSYRAQFGPPDDEFAFRWDIGNWQFPAGLEYGQQEFDAAWAEFAEALKDDCDDANEPLLIGLCERVLARLAAEGTFATVPDLEGLIVLGPDDPSEVVPDRKRRLDPIVPRRSNA